MALPSYAARSVVIHHFFYINKLGLAMRLNGWQRIGVALSIVWAIAILVAYFYELNNHPSGLANYFPFMSFEWVNDVEGTRLAHAQAVADGQDFSPKVMMIMPTFSAIGAFTISILPVVVGWLVSYLFVYTILWIRRGFKT